LGADVAVKYAYENSKLIYIEFLDIYEVSRYTTQVKGVAGMLPAVAGPPVIPAVDLDGAPLVVRDRLFWAREHELDLRRVIVSVTSSMAFIGLVLHGSS
jgi:hypothetical protein